MVNRNAARHLLLVVSVLLCFFVYMGYRFLNGTQTAPDPVADSETVSASGDVPPLSLPPSASLRPQDATVITSLIPESEEQLKEILDGWIPSAQGDDLALMPAPGGSSATPFRPPEDVLADVQAHVISGLIPTPPQDAPATASNLPIPREDPFPGQMSPPGAATMSPGSTPAQDTFMPPAGLKPPGSGSSTASSPEDFPSEDNRTDASPFAGTLVPPPPASSSRPSDAGNDAFSPISPTTESPTRPATESGSSIPSYSYQTDGDPEDDQDTVYAAVPESTAPVRPAPTRPTSSTRPSVPTEQPGYGYEEDAGRVTETDSVRIYVVRSGDTLSSIAARELGSASLADNIFLLNRDVIEDPDQLMVGVKIRLPVRDADIAGGDDSEPRASSRRASQGLARNHVVVLGDTLSSIAQQYYGTGSAWRFLYEANKNVVPDPTKMSVGTELVIPPYEE